MSKRDYLEDAKRYISNARNSIDDIEYYIEKEISAQEEEEEKLDELEELYDNVQKIETGGRSSGIRWIADNLLDQQIMDALGTLISSCDNVKLLQQLQKMASTSSLI